MENNTSEKKTYNDKLQEELQKLLESHGIDYYIIVAKNEDNLFTLSSSDDLMQNTKVLKIAHVNHYNQVLKQIGEN